MNISYLKFFNCRAIPVVCISLLFSNHCYALNANQGTPIDFGAFAQLQENAYIQLSNTGTVSKSGISNYQGDPKPSSIVYDTTLTNSYSGIVTEAVSLSSPGTITSPYADCNYTITNVSPNPSSFSLQVDGSSSSSSSREVKYGATLTLSTQCKSGVYSGTIDIPFSGRTTILGFIPWGDASTGTVPVNYTFRVWDKIGLTETQSLDFGGIMSPEVDTTVTISTNGVRSNPTGRAIFDPSNTGRNGTFEVFGTSNITFYVTLPSSAILTGSNGGSLTVNNFTATVGSNGLALDSQGLNTFNVGGTLNIPAHATPGTYQGTYDITVYY